MEVETLLTKAWAAVQKAGLPEALQAVAFREAVDLLRSAEPGATPKVERAASRRRSQAQASAATDSQSAVPDEDAFFSQLARESGQSEDDLRDIMHLTNDGKVQVTPPTKDLGKSTAEQAKTVIVLVASARSKGLGERPVDAEAVRREVDRKHCFQSNNFSHSHLGRLKGFNIGATKNEILLNSKWVDEFKAVVAQAHGRKPSGDDS